MNQGKKLLLDYHRPEPPDIISTFAEELSAGRKPDNPIVSKSSYWVNLRMLNEDRRMYFWPCYFMRRIPLWFRKTGTTAFSWLILTRIGGTCRIAAIDS